MPLGDGPRSDEGDRGVCRVQSGLLLRHISCLRPRPEPIKAEPTGPDPNHTSVNTINTYKRYTQRAGWKEKGI